MRADIFAARAHIGDFHLQIGICAASLCSFVFVQFVWSDLLQSIEDGV